MSIPSLFPLGRIVDVDAAELVIRPGPHPFELRNRRAIDENWAREKAANPALYDGRALMPARLSLEAERLTGTCHWTRFAAVVYWLRNEELDNTPHAYANAMLVTSDNALVAVEMGAHTLSAGHVCFASGGFDEEDVNDDKIDIWHNMCREILEETGLSVENAPREAGFRVLSASNGIVITTRVQLNMSGADAEERIQSFLGREQQPEIARPVIIRRSSPGGLRLAPQMPALIDWHFRNPMRA